MNEPNLETLLSANHLCIVPGVHVLAEVLVEVLEPIVEENITLDRTQTHTPVKSHINNHLKSGTFGLGSLP